MYPVSDVNWLGGKEFASIPLTSDYFPGPSHNCFDYANFDSRFYEFIDSYEKPGTNPGKAFFWLRTIGLMRQQDQQD